MHDLPRQKLRELIIEYGRSLCDDPRRCEALLKDYCGQYKREIFVLVSALKNRVAEDLINASAGRAARAGVWASDPAARRRVGLGRERGALGGGIVGTGVGHWRPQTLSYPDPRRKCRTRPSHRPRP